MATKDDGWVSCEMASVKIVVEDDGTLIVGPQANTEELRLRAVRGIDGPLSVDGPYDKDEVCMEVTIFRHPTKRE